MKQYLLTHLFKADREPVYKKSDFELSKNAQYVTLTVTREGFKDMNSRDHPVNNWKCILTKIKNLIEK
jgi:hypothetical protein